MKPGDYVVCVNDRNWSANAKKSFNKLPVAGQVYRIRRIIANSESPNGPAGLALEGIYGRWDLIIHFNGNEVFEEYHFRKSRFKLAINIKSTSYKKDKKGITMANIDLFN